MSKRNTFIEDLGVPLDKVQRKWLRRIGLICITPVIIIAGLVWGIIELVYEMYKDCW